MLPMHLLPTVRPAFSDVVMASILATISSLLIALFTFLLAWAASVAYWTYTGRGANAVIALPLRSAPPACILAFVWIFLAVLRYGEVANGNSSGEE